MQRLATTVLSVVGLDSAACLRSFTTAANVSVIQPPAEDRPDERAGEAWRQAARSHRLYTMHDADPLALVADAWAESFAGGARGDLDVVVLDTVARWRASTIGLPDYYLVLQPDEIPAGLRDWYLGVLHRAAPTRVVPVEAEGAAVRRAISRLGAGRWWPDLPDLLDGIERLLPDQVMTAASDDEDGGEDGDEAVSG